jgi:hypothetical protein
MVEQWVMICDDLVNGVRAYYVGETDVAGLCVTSDLPSEAQHYPSQDAAEQDRDRLTAGFDPKDIGTWKVLKISG